MGVEELLRPALFRNFATGHDGLLAATKRDGRAIKMK
jgi:hypothetical protein